MATVNVSYDESGDLVAPGYDIVYNMGDMAWVMTSTALVFIMIPGVGFFYSGLLRRKNALSMMYLSMAGLAVVSFQWFFWGYSLAFSETGSAFIGDLRYFALRNVYEAPSMGSTRIPASLFMIYQCMFACIATVLAIGGMAERARMGPTLVFMFLWATIVYCPIACWTWSANGWSYVMGGLDFAGGTPVHISSGTAALAIALYLGKRRGYGTERLSFRPHNTSYVILGTVFLWFGWFGFNGGSAMSANLRAVSACIVTNLAASVGGITWLVLDWRLERKWSAVGFCSGAIVGLVAITPAAGFVQASSAVLIGFLGGSSWSRSHFENTQLTCVPSLLPAVGCNFATRIKFLLRIDEALDAFATHAVGGVIGNCLTGIFAQKSVAGLDGFTVIPGGWLDQHYIQLGHQIADSVAGMAYSFVMTSILCWILHFIPGMSLRTNEETEIVGIDDAEMGEFAYDYVGLDPEARLVHHEGRPAITSNEDHGFVPATVKHEARHPDSDEEKAPGGGRVDN
ncbi:ammonium transporter AmtB-like domain-containing protein [Mrakia frigida]|uniref:ammonium transporter n=1 Tax=Mrakia frigida TaxID=29902 RepID=UPI003FCBF00D